ncbi:hypothetical protein BDN72DRAFT_901350 [Pluteus cervinus]|uniref:Uncharacterized protein n=1 Tax=Pluteus cervinus TaxID=181527 RepID=A0ACD3AGF8_9AGAR|nr:hypothetical protein BDN72DRAFT_901350 [Pluteus cervinus]
MFEEGRRTKERTRRKRGSSILTIITIFVRSTAALPGIPTPSPNRNLDSGGDDPDDETHHEADNSTSTSYHPTSPPGGDDGPPPTPVTTTYHPGPKTLSTHESSWSLAIVFCASVRTLVLIAVGKRQSTRQIVVLGVEALDQNTKNFRLSIGSWFEGCCDVEQRVGDVRADSSVGVGLPHSIVIGFDDETTTPVKPTSSRLELRSAASSSSLAFASSTPISSSNSIAILASYVPSSASSQTTTSVFPPSTEETVVFIAFHCFEICRLTSVIVFFVAEHCSTDHGDVIGEESGFCLLSVNDLELEAERTEGKLKEFCVEDGASLAMSLSEDTSSRICATSPYQSPSPDPLGLEEKMRGAPDLEISKMFRSKFTTGDNSSSVDDANLVKDQFQAPSVDTCPSSQPHPGFSFKGFSFNLDILQSKLKKEGNHNVCAVLPVLFFQSRRARGHARWSRLRHLDTRFPSISTPTSHPQFHTQSAESISPQSSSDSYSHSYSASPQPVSIQESPSAQAEIENAPTSLVVAIRY